MCMFVCVLTWKPVFGGIDHLETLLLLDQSVAAVLYRQRLGAEVLPADCVQ